MSDSSKHYVLHVYSIEVHDSAGRPEDIVTIETRGALRPATKKALSEAIQNDNVSIRENKNVLA